MKNRLDSELIGRARRVLPAVGLAVAMVGVAPAQHAFAQDINIGGNIAATVAEAVSGIATNSEPSTILGGLTTESNDLEFGEDEGTAVSDASGGNHNVSDPNAGRRGHE